MVAVASFAMLAHAQSIGLPILPREMHTEWTAIGRVNGAAYSKRSSCTGTLIKSDAVLTAAHCVMRKDGKLRSVENIHFVAGWLQGEYVWHSIARAVDVHPDYKASDDRRGLAADLAVITLANPVPDPLISPLPLVAVSEQYSEFAIVGYQRRRGNMLSAQFDCPKLRDFGPVVLIDCPVVSGLSGSPLLEKTDAGWVVSGVVVARTGPKDDGKALAVWPNAWLLKTLARPALASD